MFFRSQTVENYKIERKKRKKEKRKRVNNLQSRIVKFSPRDEYCTMFSLQFYWDNEYEMR